MRRPGGHPLCSALLPPGLSPLRAGTGQKEKATDKNRALAEHRTVSARCITQDTRSTRENISLPIPQINPPAARALYSHRSIVVPSPGAEHLVLEGKDSEVTPLHGIAPPWARFPWLFPTTARPNAGIPHVMGAHPYVGPPPYMGALLSRTASGNAQSPRGFPGPNKWRKGPGFGPRHLRLAGVSKVRRAGQPVSSHLQQTLRPRWTHPCTLVLKSSTAGLSPAAVRRRNGAQTARLKGIWF